MNLHLGIGNQTTQMFQIYRWSTFSETELLWLLYKSGSLKTSVRYWLPYLTYPMFELQAWMLTNLRFISFRKISCFASWCRGILHTIYWRPRRTVLGLGCLWKFYNAQSATSVWQQKTRDFLPYLIQWKGLAKRVHLFRNRDLSIRIQHWKKQVSGNWRSDIWSL